MRDKMIQIGLLHLSDIHLNNSSNSIFDRIPKIVDAIKLDCCHVEKLYIITSGDIAFSGKESEYSVASSLYSQLIKSIARSCDDLSCKLIFTPGNHDCDFDKANMQRANNLKTIRTDGYEAIDGSVIDTCTSIQQPFFQFMSEHSISPINKIYYTIEDEVSGNKIVFNCYNTAWLSEKKEDPGTLFYPLSTITPTIDCFAVSVFHHPYNWLTPNSEKNNSREFSSLIRKTSNIIFTGHEHESDFSKNVDISTLKEDYLVSGSVLNQQNNFHSGFNFLTVDLNTKKATHIFYEWNQENNLYSPKKEIKEVSLIHTYNDIFQLKQEFENYLDEINIPVEKNDAHNIKLQDLYVYPRLEQIGDEKHQLDGFLKASSFAEITNASFKYIIEGAEQSGKTSLCKILYRRYFDNSFCPIIINGEDITNTNSRQLVKQAFREQYKSTDIIFQKYIQLDKKKKVLFIDNLGQSSLDVNSQDILINKFGKEYSYILITVNDTFGIENLIKEKADLINFEQYRLLPFGHVQRSKLIEKWRLLGNTRKLTKQDILDYSDSTMRKINELLGVNLMPAFPANILLLLQTLEVALPHNLSMTSFGYCYETLIITRLSRVKVKNEELDSYFNFITHLAFYKYDNKFEQLSDAQIKQFVMNEYDYVYEDKMLENLLSAGILLKDSLNNISFKYSYIFFFFIAKYLSDNDNRDTKKVKGIISELCNNIQNNREANILIFLTHHAKDKKLLEDIQLTTMEIFDDVKEAKLGTEETKFMTTISNSICQKFIENRDPIKERERRLKAQDKAEQKQADNNANNDYLIEINKALKSLEVIGQITKNRYGSIKTPQLDNIIEDSCNTGLRALSFIINLFQKEDTEEELLQIATTELNNKEEPIKVRERIHSMLQYMSYLTCHFFINKIANSMGIKQLESSFSRLAEKHQTPAYELVSFIIKSRYAGTLSTDELKKLMKKYDKNILAKDILTRVVIDYIYMHSIKHNKKHIISEILGIPLRNQLYIENKANR